MAYDPIRRSQLISPHGVGSMLVVKGGVSVLACGLDSWYERENLDVSNIDIMEFEIEEYRLEGVLKVGHFRLPPDFRPSMRGKNIPNTGLTIPFVRFPRWHVCSWCNRMGELRLSDREVRIKCSECAGKGKYGYMQQAVFVAMCEQGHLQDFPWREWVHHSSNAACSRALRYVSSGGAALAAQRVRCDCGAERSLAGITQANPDGTTALSVQLESGEVYLCRGHRPWLGKIEDQPCRFQLRGTLRGATNVWFGKVYSSIYLPYKSELAPSELIMTLNLPRISNAINILSGQGSIASNLKSLYSLELGAYSEEHIEAALKVIRGEDVSTIDGGVVAEDEDTAFRRAEFDVLKSDSTESLLIIDSVGIDEYDADVARYFNRIGLVHKLRETRVFAGFSRIFSDREVPLEDRKQMLWDKPPTAEDSWLPATVVYGEGIFLEIKEDLLREWESRNEAKLESHFERLITNFERLRGARGLKPKGITPRFVFLHTLAHLLINRLTFECGYSSASLRERIYVSDSTSSPMAGILIYTAAGDSEGTMGGLVRMGKPGYFEPLIRRSIEAAEWCSADPVCREMGARSGQGPDSCNLAACHSCALLPETSCEEFNRFLDRSVVVDGPDEMGVSFFGR